jgi:hypothetical protein
VLDREPAEQAQPRELTSPTIGPAGLPRNSGVSESPQTPDRGAHRRDRRIVFTESAGRSTPRRRLPEFSLEPTQARYEPWTMR